jgi:hypothetical protein
MSPEGLETHALDGAATEVGAMGIRNVKIRRI